MKPDEPTIAISVKIPTRVWLLLRQLALDRQLAAGSGRADGSAIVAELVEAEARRVGRC